MIDSSWIDNVNAAIKWYDKTISEFPGTLAAELAYEEKIMTILGWETPGRYGQSFGLKADFERWIPVLIETFESFAVAFPDSTRLQPIRYQIAQAYWSAKNWEKTRDWLDAIIDASGPEDTFYKDLAVRRLREVEY